jgi:hypothetical protein
MARFLQALIHHLKRIFNNEYTKYELENIIPYENLLCPPWKFNIDINLNLHLFPTNSTCPSIYRNLFKEYYSLFPHTYIYTDAFLISGHVGMAILCNKDTIQWKLSNKCSIYTAGAMAILKAIKYAFKKVTDNSIKIFSNSLSTIISLQDHYIPSDIVRKIQNAHFKAQ